MSVEEQVKIMEGQLDNFYGLIEKMNYLSSFFKPDPMFSQEAINIVISNILKTVDE